jgi:cytochrome c biogenesis protein CcmG, thiol:disulfide interchange protein DsbE
MRRLRALVLLGPLLVACSADDPGPSADPAPTTAVADVETVLDPCPEQPDREAVGERTLPPLSFDCLGGGRLDLGRAPGAPTVLNLWGSWCAPCRAEMPLLQSVAERAGDRVRVLGVISKDGVPQADSFAADAGVTFPGAFDGEGRLMAELGINALPYTYFLDAGGALVHTETGPVESVAELEGLVSEHLGVQP